MAASFCSFRSPLGLVMTLLVAGLVAGWPLLHAAMAGGAEDALDALSRTFGYLNQRLGPFIAAARRTGLARGIRRAWFSLTSSPRA